MAYRDIKNSIDTAKQEGKNEKALEIAKNMLADGVDINLIKKYSGLTLEQIKKNEITNRIKNEEKNQVGWLEHLGNPAHSCSNITVGTLCFQ